MTKSIVLGLAILALSTSAALAAQRTHHHRAMNACAAVPVTLAPAMWTGGVSMFPDQVALEAGDCGQHGQEVAIRDRGDQAERVARPTVVLVRGEVPKASLAWGLRPACKRRRRPPIVGGKRSTVADATVEKTRTGKGHRPLRYRGFLASVRKGFSV
jgi:hypothetical protein